MAIFWGNLPWPFWGKPPMALGWPFWGSLGARLAILGRHRARAPARLALPLAPRTGSGRIWDSPVRVCERFGARAEREFVKETIWRDVWDDLGGCCQGLEGFTARSAALDCLRLSENVWDKAKSCVVHYTTLRETNHVARGTHEIKYWAGGCPQTNFATEGAFEIKFRAGGNFWKKILSRGGTP